MLLIVFLTPSPMIIKLKSLSLLIALIFTDVVQVIKVSQLNLRITSRMTFNVSSYVLPLMGFTGVYLHRYRHRGEYTIYDKSSLVNQTLLNFYTGRLSIGDHQCPV